MGFTMAGAIVLLAEGSLRWFGRMRTGVWPETRQSGFSLQVRALQAIVRPHAFLNVGGREGSEVRVFGKTVALNSLGYRSPERPLAKPAGVRRVLLAGGSTTFDIAAASNEATWAYRLERALGDVEVWNAGFPSWTSLESALSFAARDRDLAPDVVVVYQGINDLQPGSHAPFDRQYERGHADLARRALGFEYAPPGILGRSLLVERIVDRRGDRDPWDALMDNRPSGARRERLEPAALETFARNLRSIAALARDAGSRLVLATQPMRIRAAQRAADTAYLAGWYPTLVAAAAPVELERLNEVAREVARSRGLELADLAREVAWSDADFADPLHCSASGGEKLVRALAPRLALVLAATPGKRRP